MTLNKLIEKYMKLQKGGYETIIISQVINDLYQIKSIGKPKKLNSFVESLLNNIKEVSNGKV